MKLPWFFESTVFIGFIIFCVLVLLYIYHVANKYLESGGVIEGDCIDGIDREDLLINGIRKQLNAKAAAKRAATCTFSLLAVPGSPQEHIISNTKITIALKYYEEKQFLALTVEGVEGFAFGDALQQGLNFIRFHATLLPARKRKSKSQYRSGQDLDITIALGMTSVSSDDIRNCSLRLRLYGKRIEFGIPLGREKCLGESHVDLSKLSLESGEEIKGVYAVLPQGTLFPKSDDDFSN